MKVKLRALGAGRKAQLTRQADKIATELEAQRQLDEVCLVIDMDMFFAAVEVRSVISTTSTNLVQLFDCWGDLFGTCVFPTGFEGPRFALHSFEVSPSWHAVSKDTCRRLSSHYGSVAKEEGYPLCHAATYIVVVSPGDMLA